MSLTSHSSHRSTNPYAPVYSPLAVYSLHGNSSNNGQPFFHPRRTISAQLSSASPAATANASRAGHAHTRRTCSTSAIRTGDATKNSSNSVLQVLKNVWNQTGSTKRHRDIDPMELHDTHTHKRKKRSGELQQLGSKGADLTLSKDPFGWDKWETTEIGKQDGNNSSRSNNKNEGEIHRVPYGSAFIRRNDKYRAKQVPSGEVRSILSGKSDEVLFLRQIFNGEYHIPKIIADEREHQLELLARDRRNTRISSERQQDSKLKKSIVDLTDRIKKILINHKNSDASHHENNDDDDLVFIRETRVSTLEKKRQKYLDDKEQFHNTLVALQSDFKNYKQLIDERQRIQKDIRRKRQELSLQKLKIVPDLSEKQLKQIKQTLESNHNATLYNNDNIEVNTRDFKTLAPRRWLNDTIIEFFMKYIERETPHTVAFNSFFYSNLSERGYQGVRRWMKRKKVTIKSLHKIFVPINLNQSHWALGLIDIERERIVYVDSLSNGANAMSFAILNDLKNYVLQESKDTLGANFQLVHGNCPQQPNGFDCGIYVCMNTLYLSKDNELTFNSKDAPRMRNYIASLILSG